MSQEGIMVMACVKIKACCDIARDLLDWNNAIEITL